MIVGCCVWREQRESVLWFRGGEKSGPVQDVHHGSRPQTPAQKHETTVTEQKHCSEYTHTENILGPNLS